MSKPMLTSNGTPPSVKPEILPPVLNHTPNNTIPSYSQPRDGKGRFTKRT